MIMRKYCIGVVRETNSYLVQLSRCVSKKSADAVKKTSEPIVASSYRYFGVNSVLYYNALAVMADAMPGLQQVRLESSKYGEEDFKFNDGEEPEEIARTAEYTALNIVDVLSPANFPNLHALYIDSDAPLNGKYPSLFNFSNLEKLTISRCNTIKFGFDMLAGLPSLKEFECVHNKLATGNLKDLSVCQNTLERIEIVCSDSSIGGNFMDLANFPHLKSLRLRQTKVTGQLRDIGDNDFPKLEVLNLPSTVVGGDRYEIQRVAEAKELINDLLPLRRKRPELFSDRYFHWKLSDESEDIANPRMDEYMPDYHNYCFSFVQAGSRLGWRWEKKFDYTPDHPFEVHWLDPVPNKKSNDYQAYADVAKSFIPSGAGRFFKGLYEPPSYTVFNRLSRNYVPSAEEMEMWENL
jgi:hypothetical protein